MKTIAITIDESGLSGLDHLAEQEGKNRSELVREAVHQYLADWESTAEEEKERKIFRRLRKQLGRQAAALVKEQADL